MNLDFEKDVTIDESALDVEWLEHPSKVLRYGKHLAGVLRRLELAKESLNVVKAEIDKAIRQKPGNYGIDKITETQVSNAVILDEAYQEANKEVIELRYEYEMSKTAFQAITSRRDALQSLTSLYGQQYFAGPRIPRDLANEMEKRRTSNATVASKLKRKQT